MRSASGRGLNRKRQRCEARHVPPSELSVRSELNDITTSVERADVERRLAESLLMTVVHGAGGLNEKRPESPSAQFGRFLKPSLHSRRPACDKRRDRPIR